MPPLRCYILVAGAFRRVGYGRFADRYSIDLSIIECVTRKKRVFVGNMVVNSSLEEMFIRRLRSREQVFPDPAGSRSAVRQRKQIQIWSDLGMQCHRAAIDDADPCIGVRNECRPADAESFNEPFISKEVERFVPRNRPTECGSKLISLEGRNGFGPVVEEVFRIQCGIPEEFKGGPVNIIRAARGDPI